MIQQATRLKVAVLLTVAGLLVSVPAQFAVAQEQEPVSQGLSDLCQEAYDNGITACPLVGNASTLGFLRAAGTSNVYTFEAPSPRMRVRVELTNLPSDYDLYLVDPAGTLVAQSVQDGLADEVIEANLPQPGQYYLHVAVDPSRVPIPELPYRLSIVQQAPGGAAEAPPAAAFPTPTREPVYQTREGDRTERQLREELERAGYGGPLDVPALLAAYERATAPATPPPLPAVHVTCSPNAGTGYLPLKRGPGRTFQELRVIEKGETVSVLAWSYTSDSSARIPWLYVRTSDGQEGWMQSREDASGGTEFAYPTCIGIEPRNQDPATYPVSTRSP